MALSFELKSIRDASLSGIVELGTFWVGTWDKHNKAASVPEDLVVPRCSSISKVQATKHLGS